MTARNKEVLKRKKYLVDEKWRKRREDYERFKPHKKQRHRVKMHPEIEIVKWIESAQKIKTSLSMGPELFYDRIREYLSILVKKANLRKRIEDLKGKIMSLTNFTIDQRLMLVKLVERWIDDCRVYVVKSIALLEYYC